MPVRTASTKNAILENENAVVVVNGVVVVVGGGVVVKLIAVGVV